MKAPLLPALRNDLVTVITKALEDPAFFPEGCLLGFGLSHVYPVSKSTDFSALKLKGVDAILMSVLESIGLKGKIKALYKGKYDSDYDSDDSYSRRQRIRGAERWITEEIVAVPHYDECGELEDAYRRSANSVEVTSYKRFEDACKGIEIGIAHESGKPLLIWVTPPSEKTRHSSNFVAYGNEAELATVYADLNLVFTVEPKEKRGTA